jgi:hypothetical protein
MSELLLRVAPWLDDDQEQVRLFPGPRVTQNNQPPNFAAFLPAQPELSCADRAVLCAYFPA